MISSAMPTNNKLHLVSDGERFSRLTVLGFSHHDKRWRRHYLVRCDCGNEKTVQGTLLRSGNTRSCGCLSKESRAKKRLPDNTAEVNAVILQYKRHAKTRGINFPLSRDEVSLLIRKPCHYCGAIAGNLKRTKDCPSGFPHNGIDRVNSDRDYSLDNVVPCCGGCNRAKGTKSADDFISWAKRVAEQWG